MGVVGALNNRFFYIPSEYIMVNWTFYVPPPFASHHITLQVMGARTVSQDILRCCH